MDDKSDSEAMAVRLQDGKGEECGPATKAEGKKGGGTETDGPGRRADPNRIGGIQLLCVEPKAASRGCF